MKVELSIKDDSELRNIIKDMITGQVKSLIREDFAEILQKAIDEKISNVSVSSYDITKIMREKFSQPGINELILPVIEKQTKEVCDSAIYKIVDDRASAHINRVMQAEVTRAVNIYLAKTDIQLSIGNKDD